MRNLSASTERAERPTDAAVVSSRAARRKRAERPALTESHPSELPGHARILHLSPGLHVVTVGSVPALPTPMAGFTFPATFLSAAPNGTGVMPEIGLAKGEAPGWLGAEGGAALVRVPAEGAGIVVTTYGIADPSALPSLQAQPVAGGARIEPAGVPIAAESAEQSTHGIDLEIMLHVERQGDRKMLARGWVGNPGRQLRVEAFSVRPLQAIMPGDIEYMALGPRGQRTSWVSDGKMCGSRGRGLPLTGFAVRMMPTLGDRFDVIYEGSFFASGRVGPFRNGEPCVPTIVDDPLEAIRLQVVERPRG